jgi:hypothetical protein
LLASERLRERVARGRDIRTGKRVVAEMDRAIGAERHCLVERADRALGPHRHRHDLLDLDDATFLDLHRRLDRVRVVGVERSLAAAIHPPCGRVDPFAHGGVRHLFDQDADLHRGTPSADGWRIRRGAMADRENGSGTSTAQIMVPPRRRCE